MAGPIRVLHVDDDPDLGALVAEVLQRQNDRFEVSTVTGVSQALNYIESDDHAFDCLVSDYDMPAKNGIELLEAIRDTHPDLPFILYTGKGSEEVASEAISAGATDYLQKGTSTGQYTVLANRIQNAVEQYRSERRAEEHQRITKVVRDLNRALVYADSADEIEREVCAILSDADPYVTACFANVNTDTMQVEPRTWAGNAAGYFANLDMSVDEGSPGRHAPGGRAYHEREIAVSQDISDDPEYERWRDAATERGFQSLAVIPVEYGDELYGLLAVFASRRYAFDETEQELLAELGDDIAHAMHAQDVQSVLQTRNRAINEAPVGITVTDPDETDNPMIYVNDEYTEISGYIENEALGENCRMLQGPQTDHEPVATMREAVDNEERVTVELRNYRNGGELFWNRVSIAPVYDDEDQLTNYVGFQEDITDRKEYEQELRQNERRFEALFNDPNLLVGLLATDGTLLNVNETAVEYIDAERDAVIGEQFWTTPWWSEEMQPVIQEKVQQAAAGEYVQYTADLATPDGDPYSVKGVIRPVTDDEGTVRSLIVSARDVTEQEKSDRILNAILENTTTPMFLKDRNGEYLLANQQFIDLFNLNEKTVIGKTDDELFPPKMAETVTKNDQAVLDHGEAIEVEEDIVVDGEDRVYLSSKVPVYDIGIEPDSDRPVAVFGVANDITGRKKREQELELLYQAINEAPVGVTLTDPTQEDNPIIYANDEFTNITGYSREESLGKNHRVLQGPETTEQSVREMREAIDSGESVSIELRNYRKDGTMFWKEVTIAPVFDRDGNLRNFIEFQEDINDRKERERELRQSDRRFKAIFEDPNILVGLLEPDGSVISTNETANKYLDANPDEFIGDPIWDTPWFVGDEPLQEEVKEMVEQAADGEYVECELDHSKALGEDLVASGAFRPVTNEDGTVVSLILSTKDITERKRKTRELAESEARYQSLIEDVLDTSEVGTFILNDEFEIVWVNETMATYFDLDRETVIGSDKRQLIDTHVSDIVEESTTFKDRVLSAYEDNSQPLEFECHVLSAPGREQRWLKHWSKPIESGYYEGGRIEHYTNITEQKRRNQQLDVLDRVLRHNLRNSMNIVLGNAEVIGQRADDELSALTDPIIERGQWLLSLTEKQRKVVELLTTPLDLRPANVSTILRDAAEQFRDEYPDADITVQVPDQLEANVVPQLDQAVGELVENAILHGCDGAITVELSAAESGDSVQLAVSDPGPSIPEPEQAILRGDGEHGPLYHGSGMGLWLVNRIVAYSGGHIEYHHDDHGTTVRLILEQPS